jgi:hypothetical protein
VDRERFIGVCMNDIKVEVGNLIKLTRQPDDDNIWIVVDVRRFFKSEDRVNAVRIRTMNNSKEIWYPSRHIEVIG